MISYSVLTWNPRCVNKHKKRHGIPLPSSSRSHRRCYIRWERKNLCHLFGPLTLEPNPLVQIWSYNFAINACGITVFVAFVSVSKSYIFKFACIEVVWLIFRLTQSYAVTCNRTSWLINARNALFCWYGKMYQNSRSNLLQVLNSSLRNSSSRDAYDEGRNMLSVSFGPWMLERDRYQIGMILFWYSARGNTASEALKLNG